MTSLTSSASPASTTARARSRGTASPRARNSSQPGPVDSPGSGRSTVCSRARRVGRGGAQRGDEVGAEELPRREEEAGVGLVEDERRLLALQAGVERDEPGPGGEDAQPRRDPRRRVRRPHGHTIARLDAGRDQAARHRRHPVLDVDERESGLAVDDRVAIAEACRAGPDHPRDRPVPVLGVPVGVGHATMRSSASAGRRKEHA